ncbi:P6 [Blackcurrant leafroll-associated virus 1]|nr:P6 [Blackcurrant leafroll-associated virus 1]AXN56988.1 P6 [Blackcurrant leafroll-associated virus 1]
MDCGFEFLLLFFFGDVVFVVFFLFLFFAVRSRNPGSASIEAGAYRSTVR